MPKIIYLLTVFTLFSSLSSSATSAFELFKGKIRTYCCYPDVSKKNCQKLMDDSVKPENPTMVPALVPAFWNSKTNAYQVTEQTKESLEVACLQLPDFLNRQPPPIELKAEANQFLSGGQKLLEVAEKIADKDYNYSVLIYCCYGNKCPKLMVEDQRRSLKSPAFYRVDKSDYAVAEDTYTGLQDKCKSQLKKTHVNPTKNILLRASDAEMFETFANYYPITQLAVSDIPTEALLETTLDKSKKTEFDEVFKDPQVKVALQKIFKAMEKKNLTDTIDKLKQNPNFISKLGYTFKLIGTDKRTLSALATATALATGIYAPTYVGEGTRFIFPYVYALLFGSVPSITSWDYWASFITARAWAQNWAMNNSGFILGTAKSAIVNLASSFWSLFSSGPSNVRSKEELKQHIIEIADKIQ